MFFFFSLGLHIFFFKLFSRRKLCNTHLLFKINIFFFKKLLKEKKIMYFFFKNKNNFYCFYQNKFVKNTNLFLPCGFKESNVFSLTNKNFIINLLFFLKKTNKIIIIFNNYIGIFLKLCVQADMVFFLYPDKYFKYFLISKTIGFCSSVVEH